MLALEYDPEEARQAWIDYGIERGIELGIELGIERGIERGIEQVAKNLLMMNFSIDDIVNATGLNEDDVRNLAKNDL